MDPVNNFGCSNDAGLLRQMCSIEGEANAESAIGPIAAFASGGFVLMSLHVIICRQ